MLDRTATPRRRLRMLLPALAFALGLGITLLIWHSLIDRERVANQTEFELRVQAVADRVEQRLQGYQEVLHGAQGLFVASGSVTRIDFRDYVDSLRLQEIYPGIQGIGYAQIIAAADKERESATIRSQVHPNFSIWPEGERDPYTAIVFLEPFRDRNLRALGYDMYTEPTRRAAMEAARDSGEVHASGKVVLVQEAGKGQQPGFLTYLPVYRKDAPHITLAERRANIIGWVYAPFRVGDLMNGILGNMLDHEIALEFHDDSVPSAPSLLFRSVKHTENAPAAAFEAIKQIRFSGHQWTCERTPCPPSRRAWATHGCILHCCSAAPSACCWPCSPGRCWAGANGRWQRQSA